MKNKAKDEEWCLKIYNENGEWNLKTGIDATETTVLIENKSTNMVLSVEDSGKKVIEEQQEDDNRRQIWYKSKPDRKGYFTLTNNNAMLLTVTSSNDIIVRGNLQGPPLGIDIMYLILADRNMQLRFGLKVVWES